MITYTEQITSFWDLDDLCWSGARDRINEIIEYGLEQEFWDYLQENFDSDSEYTLTDINDFIWFECDDWIEEHKGDNE